MVPGCPRGWMNSNYPLRSFEVSRAERAVPSSYHAGMSLDSQHLRAWMTAPDEALLRQCRIETYRASGPGGQKRNKTSSAVRLTLGETGIHAVGTESRSQHENKARALHRVRERIALEIRLPLPPEPGWPEGFSLPGAQLKVNSKNPHYVAVVALALDALAAFAGEPRAAADWLGVTPTSLIRFLADFPEAWVALGKIRNTWKLGPLKK